MSDVQIVLTEELPETIGYAAEWGPGFIHLAVRPEVDPCEAVAEALATMIDCYPPQELEDLNPSCMQLSRIA